MSRQNDGRRGKIEHQGYFMSCILMLKECLVLKIFFSLFVIYFFVA